jgi:tetratricopeptide (TPR) repeat protein/tRNA A-37 threonylcarbamoyl transferase component Bud32
MGEQFISMLKPGDKVHHYELVRLLGRGGMGEVYLARDSVLERNVALKFLPDELENDPRMRERFLREAKSAAALDHPFICKIYETGAYQGKGFIAMEYVEGETLKDRMERERVPLREAIRITLEIGEALENAHKAGIVHRDLKPANIMLSAQGHTKVMDFGLAKHILPGTDASGVSRTMTQQSLTQHGAIAGTIAYMSPEQAKGAAVDGRSDIFSLGIILYEMITGGNPFSKPSPVETLTSILRDAAPATHVTPKSVNPLLNPIVHKALAKNPEERYLKIEDFVADLQKAYREVGGGGGLLFSRRLLVVAGAVLVIALGAFIVNKLIQRPPAPVEAQGPKTISVLIADVTNTTGDPMLDGVLEQLLGISLGGTENISLFERKSAVSLINRLDPKSDGRITQENARLLCRRENINAIINASITQERGVYQIKAAAVDPVSGQTLAEAGQTIRTKADILKAADYLSARLRAGLGVIPPGSSEALIKETFTTMSLEAMKEYADGQRFSALGKKKEAIAAYLRAADQDPNFGRAFGGLAATYYNMGQHQLADKYYKEALDRIDQMTELEKHRTRGGYYLSKSNFKRAGEEYAALVQLNPKDDVGYGNLAFAYFIGRRMAEAYDVGLKAVDLDPDNLDVRNNQSWYALAAGNFEKAREEARKALSLDPKYEKTFLILALVDLAEGRPAEAAKDYDELERLEPDGASFAAGGRADLAVYEGRIGEAVGSLEKSVAVDIENKSNYMGADKLLILARAFLLQGKSAAAVQAAERAIKLYGAEEHLYAAGEVFIAAGQDDKARAIAGELGKRVQDVHLAYAKLLGGYLSLERGDTGNAVKLIDEAQGLVDTWLGRFALGRAYLEAGAYAEASAEFEKCLKRKGEALSVFLNDLPTVRYLDSLDYYVGRALEGQGKREAAKESYAKFLKIKEKANTGQTMIEDAKKRLNTL